MPSTSGGTARASQTWPRPPAKKKRTETWGPGRRLANAPFVWFGLVWFGLVWFGSVCLVLLCFLCLLDPRPAAQKKDGDLGGPFVQRQPWFGVV